MRQSSCMFLGKNVRKITVSAGIFLLARAAVVDTSALVTGRIITNISRGVHMGHGHAAGPSGEHEDGIKPGLELLGKGGHVCFVGLFSTRFEDRSSRIIERYLSCSSEASPHHGNTEVAVKSNLIWKL
jgi:hypothetical protein